MLINGSLWVNGEGEFERLMLEIVTLSEMDFTKMSDDKMRAEE